MKNKELNENIHKLKSDTIKLQNQINDLVINNNPNTDAEVVQARNGKATLNDRLNAIEESVTPIEDAFIDTLIF